MSVEKCESWLGIVFRKELFHGEKIEHGEYSKLDKTILEAEPNFVMLTIGSKAKQVHIFVKDEINKAKDVISPLKRNLVNSLLRHEVNLVWKSDCAK